MFTDTDLGDQPAHEAGAGAFDGQFAADAHMDDHDQTHDVDHAHGPADPDASGLDAVHHVGAPSSGPDHEPTASDGDLVVVSADGSEIDLGQPNLSYGGHGVDAVAVEGSDGTVEVYADSDHDGDVDVALRIDADGSFTAWTTDGEGHWTVHATGHVDSAGTAVVDSTIDPAAAGTEPSVAAATSTPSSTPTSSTDGPASTTEEASYPGVAAGDIAVAADGHYIDAGPAKYDLDGDGRAETAVVQADGRIIQVSDTDGDGRADEMLQVDTATHQAAILTDDGSGKWEVAATGHIGADGGFVEEHTAGVTASSDPAAQAHPTSDTHPPPTTPSTTEPSSTEPSGTHGDTGHAPDIVYVATNGAQVDLGAPKEDLDGDGVPESVAVRTDDGHVLVLSDTNADGHPDQVIQIDPASGEAIWAVPDGHGGWEVVQTGHVQADGSLVIDPTGHPVSSHTDSGQDAPVSPPDAGEHDKNDENVEVGVAGRSFDAGPATIDSNGDGVPDTVSVAGPGGSTLFYQDSDGDGVADKAWTADASGQVTANYALTPSGNWVAVAPTGERS
ncbi:hypothetical protein ABIB25_002649 [Nakamurella sp. UYEF19]|uniref:DUF6802 family protein n=1 Tax=Nakamurella sp. UYEF19 TaxID=1756392 RepID=UPI0033951D73